MVRFVAAFLLLASVVSAQETAGPAETKADDSSRPRLKISVSRDDMNLRTAKAAKGDLVEFHLFVEGPPVRGVDFGVRIDGGEFVGYLPNFDDRTWQPLLIPDPYPGTICQAGMNCYASPCRLGKVLVRVTKPGEKIVADVIPSVYQQHALVMNCDYSTTNGLLAFPAAVNTAAPESHTVDGVEYVFQGFPVGDEEYPDHQHAPGEAAADSTP